MFGVVILGNGFDLDLGLKTSYVDFLQSSFFSKHCIPQNDYIFNPIKKLTTNKWIDLEYKLKDLAMQYSHNRLFCESMASYINIEFTILNRSLCDYISYLEYQVNKDSTAAKVIECINYNRSFQTIFSYNYTDLRQITTKLGIELDHRINIEYVHGSVNDRSIILGIDDEADISNLLLFMIKSFSAHYSSHNIQFALDRADEIIFFGHSLGEIDYHYFDTFFQRQSEKGLKEEQKRKITIFTLNEKSRIDILTQLHKMNNKRTDLLFNYNTLKIFCTGEESYKDKINDYCQSLKDEEDNYRRIIQHGIM